MLELFTRHGGFDFHLKVNGDLAVDQHHTVEDVGIVLGQAFEKAPDSKHGILRAPLRLWTLGPHNPRG
jgi:imidazoleglycerol-phosphate dehydratase